MYAWRVWLRTARPRSAQDQFRCVPEPPPRGVVLAALRCAARRCTCALVLLFLVSRDSVCARVPDRPKRDIATPFPGVTPFEQWG